MIHVGAGRMGCVVFALSLAAGTADALGGTVQLVTTAKDRQASGTNAQESAYGDPSHQTATNPDELLVFLKAGTDPAAYGSQYGLNVAYGLASNHNAYVFSLDPASGQSAGDVLKRVTADTQSVRAAYINERTGNVLFGFTPNDPYFHKGSPTPEAAGQWHLSNEHGTNVDVKVLGAWNQGVTGKGVTIGIVDDGIETAHPDLAGNYKPSDSWDFAHPNLGGNDSDPNHFLLLEGHGTAVAGLAAAQGGNGIGVTGAAPEANVAALRWSIFLQDTAMLVDATLYRSSNGIETIDVKNHSYGVVSEFILKTAEADALSVSAADKTIHVFAAGNSAMDVNTMDVQNSHEAITVSAVGSDGRFAEYSNFGAALFVCSPSNSAEGLTITTTDRTIGGYNDPGTSDGDAFPDTSYTSKFGGTSASAPVVAGIMALGKQVRPNMDTRFAKHLLVLSSDVIDPTDSSLFGDGWITNSAGNQFNQNYGFGLVNAAQFVDLAHQYAGVTQMITEDTGVIQVDEAIVDGSVISRQFQISSQVSLEDILVTIDFEHGWSGDLNIELTSPTGTTSRLLLGGWHQTGPWERGNWTFLSNAFWGENPYGLWTITLADIWEMDSGRWYSFSVQANMGELIPVPLPAAAWAGLAMLGMLGGFRSLRRRHRTHC